MTLHQLSNAIEKHHVDNENGWGVEVPYTYRESNLTINVRTFPEVSGEDKDRKETGRDKKSEKMSFLTLFLDTAPKIGDYITFDGKTWYIKEKKGFNPYDVVAEADTKFSRGRK